MLPFTDAWWNAPPFYPATGVSAFTENLVGLAPLASPILWLTGNPLTAYNLAVFLTWPLSAFAAYLLVKALTGRVDAAIVGGIAYGFTPYRMMELSHVQMLASFWLPLCLRALHGYIADGRRRWLWMFAVCWILNALTNGHFLLFGGVFVALWLLYFGTASSTWRRAGIALGAIALASLPLLPVLLRYQAVHDQYGLFRTPAEIQAFSANPRSWFEISSDTWFWPRWIGEGRDNLFPGITPLALLVAAAVAAIWRRHGHVVSTRTHRLRLAAGIVSICALLAIAAALVAGPWSLTIAGVLVRMRDLDRALIVVALSGAAFVWLTPSVRNGLQRRSPFLFYAAMVPTMALLCCGPVLRANGEAILSPAPYRWLMALPGFDQLRVPLRFWMLGVLSLSAAGGLGFARLTRDATRAPALLIAALVGLTLDGWIHSFRLAEPPSLRAEAEPADRRVPILELPIGGGWEQDWAATFRAAGHRRRVVNGVSGYNPPHYAALVSGLERRDPAMLDALASLGPIDVVVNRDGDPGGAIERYVASHAGSTRLHDGGDRVVYALGGTPLPSPVGTRGRATPIVGARTVRHGDDARLLFDGDLETVWADAPQQFDQWVVLDLGEVTEVAALTCALGGHPFDFPRGLLVEVSADGTDWVTVWQGGGAAPAFLALAAQPREGWMSVSFEPRTARFVRLQQTDAAPAQWTVAEVRLYGRGS
jgi:hypothetical protein